MTYANQVDALDLQRTGLLLMAAAEMSKDRYVLTRYSTTGKAWRVSVRLEHPKGCRCAAPRGCPGVVEHVAASKETLMLALDRAVQWLRTSTAALDVLTSQETP